MAGADAAVSRASLRPRPMAGRELYCSCWTLGGGAVQGATLGGPGWWFGLVVLLGTRLDDHLAVRHACVFWCPCV